LERAYVLKCLEGLHCSGDGPFTKQCEAILMKELQAPRVLLTTSGTHALELCALLGDFEPGDEFIVPSFTFPSTATAFYLRGMKPIFTDIRPDTLNLNEAEVSAKITPRTRAIVAMHYGGVGCEMDALSKLARKHDILLFEDNAHGLFGKYRGKPLGTFGALGAQSFHETKNLSAGEGGALVVNDTKLTARAEILREKGTDRSRFFRGEVDKYTWVDIGSSYVLSDILAAILLGQLQSREMIQAHRKNTWDFYNKQLAQWAANEGVRLPVVPSHCESSYHLFYLLMPSAQDQIDFLGFLKERSIYAVHHYLPLHSSKMGLRLGGKKGMCPVTESVADRLVRLPLHNALTVEDAEWVVEQVVKFRCQSTRAKAA
jgi:dTDP-4-amino-4,6-dideoxygalactose transaminase